MYHTLSLFQRQGLPPALILQVCALGTLALVRFVQFFSVLCVFFCGAHKLFLPCGIFAFVLVLVSSPPFSAYHFLVCLLFLALHVTTLVRFEHFLCTWHFSVVGKKKLFLFDVLVRCLSTLDCFCLPSCSPPYASRFIRAHHTFS